MESAGKELAETVQVGKGSFNRDDEVKTFFPKGLWGFLIYTLCLIAAAMMLPAQALDSGSKQFIFIVGALAIWRYSWGMTHFIRALLYKNVVFPKHRKLERAYAKELMPSKVYLLVTSFRIETDTSLAVFKSVIEEAIRCGVDCTIVPSIVEAADEKMVKTLFKQYNPPERVQLKIVRIPGTGKRDGLAQGFRAISRDMPPSDAVVAVVDGDSVLEDGLVSKTATFFKMMPDIGALTTDEECEVKGSKIIRQWHSLRFAQRQLLMSSMGLSKRVLTLTGRMSMFRGSIITDPDFIKQVEDDYLEHWRFGRLRFLTGDDKSSWYWVLKNGWSMLYVPDVQIYTVEHPPHKNFLKASTVLMRRWFGNMLRTNERALDIPPHTTGFFTWWCLLDQRMSMWTALSGPVFVTFLCIKYSIAFLAIYLVWIGFTRWVMSIMLLGARNEIHWSYPFLLYYNQIYGSLIKTYVFFRLDKQSWTRQKTKLSGKGTAMEQRMLNMSSLLLHSFALVVFVSLIGLISGVLKLPI
ncbi:MAG: glycosyltransferase family 2 protein [Alphaproteobacteria bacterium]|nr:glycosyltransferase family 2 protein [Alphaproteobacteria bacterium]NCQ87675.1 glycosyltransferase family 2 protein [Alphaproteobacteria bacterium]NCT05816.1 glycosyltransferase family 2 protein [Alphaproteobacteria bacterium]